MTAPVLTDPVFEAWAAVGLVWLPGRGMGRLTHAPVPYDEDYFAEYAARANTEMGRKITAERVDLVNRYTVGPVIDIGIGCGAFIEARDDTWGYDVNPAGIRWIRERDCWRNPYEGQHEAITLWDVLEHIPDPGALLRNVSSWVFVSLPTVPDDGPPATDWRHYKPGEHVWYWTRDGLIGWMAEHGFECVEHNTLESLLGRLDISSFAFRRAG